MHMSLPLHKFIIPPKVPHGNFRCLRDAPDFRDLRNVKETIVGVRPNVHKVVDMVAEPVLRESAGDAAQELLFCG